MAARLGIALYWAGWVIGALIMALGLFLAASMGSRSETWLPIIVASIAAGLVWLLGRAARFVLTGD